MSDVHRTIEAVWKIESTRLIAAIARVTGPASEQMLHLLRSVQGPASAKEP